MLQRQVEELDEMRLAHYQEVMEHEEEVWDIVQGKVRSAPSHIIRPNSIPSAHHYSF